ncbi:MAG: Bifunctional (p)ppGpp synthase/hydrolase SpoT [Bacteroidetes bacterium ADurb.Bin139]|nr:MAG: Bifunctional (p)ppGpp synthase/hydrolase SpoT [Bacteroidetes bacterium ADurb.Bin139]HOZ19483.1 HD domain-containing protein [Bacteroidales bacterium]HPB77209.1 HD domain-containing protein [Bacteroidales bacterium]HQN81465.1 HD domain-containing protein [Bacteroidales bacterium]HQP63874.1 HD domain-containing protein [Bacteroidales bacterium]
MDILRPGKKNEALYKQLVQEQRDIFLKNAAINRLPEDLERIRQAYEYAYRAHEKQTRKTGEPYILHPIAVARIVNEELGLGTNPIIASLLHDVVEDTPCTTEEIKELFGEDIAFLVDGLTKEKMEQYELSMQVDNIRKMLMTIQYDIRALLIKLADRLHNMRTLAEMPLHKQMKITGETDFFFAPLANRLGLHNVKTELENLSFKFRSPEEYARIQKILDDYAIETQGIRNRFVASIEQMLRDHNINATITQDIRSVYSIWRHMKQKQVPFRRLESVYIFNIVYELKTGGPCEISEKNQCLEIYSLLTDLYTERVGSFHNYVDNPKANGYEALHCMFMTEHGTWAEVHIKSKRMQEASIRGSIVNRHKHIGIGGVDAWVEEFRGTLKDMVYHDGFNNKDGFFLEGVKANLYSDDIRVFTPKGEQILLPSNATALDFAYVIHSEIGDHALFARVNGMLCSIKTVLKRGDRVEIGTSSAIMPQKDWLKAVVTYKAKSCIRSALRKQNISVKPSKYKFAKCCSPLPGDELLGFEAQDGSGKVFVHTRNCEHAIKLSTEHGETIVNVDIEVDDFTYYPARIYAFGVDRKGITFEISQIISEEWGLNINNMTVTTKDALFECDILLEVRSAREINSIIARLESVLGVEEVRRKTIRRD